MRTPPAGRIAPVRAAVGDGGVGAVVRETVTVALHGGIGNAHGCGATVCVFP